MSWSKHENIRNASHWISRKIELIEKKDYQKQNKINPTIHRGGIFNVELGNGNIGSEKNKTRPCLVLSGNQLNGGDTVLIIPLSSKFKFNIVNGIKIPAYKNHYLLYKSKYSFLNADSCVKFEDIRCVDKVRINNFLGNVELSDLSKMESRLKFTFGF